MLSAGLLGLLAASSLVVGALIAIFGRPPRAVVGLVMAFGAGALISSVAYDLLGEAVVNKDTGGVTVGLLAGAIIFVAGDFLIDRMGGADRKHGHVESDGRGPAIVLGTVLDGLPESFVLGLSLLEGGTAGAFSLIVAVFVSNVPEAIGGSASLLSAKWPRARILVMWAGIALFSGLAAAIGYGVFDANESLTGRRAEAFAAGAILAMLADTMMPEAFEYGGRWAGIFTVFGFIMGVGLTVLY